MNVCNGISSTEDTALLLDGFECLLFLNEPSWNMLASLWGNCTSWLAAASKAELATCVLK